MDFTDTMQLQFLDPTPLVAGPDGTLEHQDIYKREASRMFAVPYAEVTDAQREDAKKVMYRKIYSAPVWKL